MSGERILVVDDEPVIGEMVKVALEEAGYQCYTASGYESALQRLSEQPCDLLLLDMMMPRRSGIELFKEVVISQPDIAVVFISAAADPKLASDVMGLGAFGYLVKPVSLEQLERVVAGALKLRRERMLHAARVQAGPGNLGTGGQHRS